MPNYLFGKQPFAKEFAQRYKLPLIAGMGGAESMYPEFAAKLKNRNRRRGARPLADRRPAIRPKLAAQ